MAKGLSFESFGGVVNVCKQTLYNWIKKYPDFETAKALGDTRSLLWWERQAISNLVSDGDTKFNATLWIVNMCNRHGWSRTPEPRETESPKLTININGKDAVELKQLFDGGSKDGE